MLWRYRFVLNLIFSGYLSGSLSIILWKLCYPDVWSFEALMLANRLSLLRTISHVSLHYFEASMSRTATVSGGMIKGTKCRFPARPKQKDFLEIIESKFSVAWHIICFIDYDSSVTCYSMSFTIQNHSVGNFVRDWENLLLLSLKNLISGSFFSFPWKQVDTLTLVYRNKYHINSFKY